jgi:uncharacterized protein YbbK (DUF523 family)
MSVTNQRDTILRMLEHSPVCGTTFLEMYIPRYAARIHELRTAGHEIATRECRQHEHESRQTEYYLDPNQKALWEGEQA